MKINAFVSKSPLCGVYNAYHSTISDLQNQLIRQEKVHFLQALVLTGLFFESKAVRPTELSRALQVSASNLSHSLRGLEKMGLISRSMLKEDARAYAFSLNPSGKRKAVRLIKIFDSLQNRIEAAGGRELNPDLKRFVKIYGDTQGKT